MASGKRGECDLWMWDGAGEYEGLLLKLDEGTFSARIRQVKKGVTSVSGLGRRLPASTPDAQRQFCERKFLAHFKGTAEGTLFEAEVASVQVSAQSEFEYLISGKFNVLDEKQLEVLRTLSDEVADALRSRRVS
jgi:hypothetical protein